VDVQIILQNIGIIYFTGEKEFPCPRILIKKIV
jgi:hypothetical protein